MGGEHLYGKERLKCEKSKEKKRRQEEIVTGKRYLQGGNLQEGQTEGRRKKWENKEGEAAQGGEREKINDTKMNKLNL